MLSPITIPGLFITGTDTEVGKTIVAGAIANWFRRRGLRIAVCKPVASGCVRRREGLVSEDAEFLAHCADTPHPLDIICPQRYVEPLAPAVAAQRAKQPLDWEAIERSLSVMSKSADAIIIEGVGGIRVPLHDSHTVLDMAKWLNLPTIIVARPSLGTINHTLLTLDALRNAAVRIAGVVINRYPAETPDTVEETSPKAIEKWGKVPILCHVPNDPLHAGQLPPGIIAAVDMVDWQILASR